MIIRSKEIDPCYPLTVPDKEELPIKHIHIPEKVVIPAYNIWGLALVLFEILLIFLVILCIILAYWRRISNQKSVQVDEKTLIPVGTEDEESSQESNLPQFKLKAKQ